MKNINYFLILFFGTLISYGQALPNVVPPSPEASAAFKFTEMPVSLYTGLPSISIPLFEIESGGYTLPISMSYHARGVQVAEIAPRVGMGWTLNYGGMVTVQVRGIDDRLPYQCVNYSNFFSSASARDAVKTNNEGQNAATCDMIPDQYSFSVNGISGKCIKDPIGGGYVAQQYSNIIMSPPYSMTDDKGNGYSFGQNGATDQDQVYSNQNLIIHNSTYAIGPNSSDPVFPNTWHLTKINTATNKNILFYHSAETTNHWRRSKDTGFAPNADSYAAYTQSTQQRIDSISFDKGKLKFEYSQTEREDLPGSYSLHKITLYNNKKEIVKQAIFDYEYTVSTDYSNINWYLASADPTAYKRLFLKSIQFADKDGNTLPPYQFEYNPTVLPSRHSNSVDVWGYYNGKNNGTFLERTLDNGSVDVEKVQAGLLQTMIKPEGGRVNFYYEPNLAVNVFPETISFGNPNPSNKKEAFLDNLSSELTYEEPDTGAILPCFNGVKTFSKIFRISDLQTGLIKYTLWGSGVDSCPCLGPSTTNCANCRYSVQILKLNPDNTIATSYNLLHGNQVTINLEPAKYKLVVSYTGNGEYNPFDVMGDQFFSASVTWDEEITSPAPAEFLCVNSGENYTGTKVVYAAGNRIYKIEYKENEDSTPVLTKTYSYTSPNGYCSGRLLGLTNFVSVGGTLNGQPANAETDPFGSGGGSPFSTYQGNSVGYKYVTEYNGTGSNTLGKTEYEYTMIYDTGRYYEFPYHPPTDNEWLRGKELRVSHFKKTGSTYQLVQETKNTYLLGDSVEFTGALTTDVCGHPFFKPSVKIPITQNLGSSGGYVKNKRYFTIPAVVIPVLIPGDEITEDAAGYKTYYMTGGTMDLKRSVTTTYPDNGAELVATNEFNYRYDSHYNVWQQSSTASDDTSLTTAYLYPSDPEMVNEPAVGDLIGKKMQVPLSIQTYKAGAKLSETKTTYKNWATTPKILLPEFVKTAKAAETTFETRLEHTRNSNGNLREVRQTNGIYISYIWGYNDLYPIAKVENAQYSALTSYLSALQSASNNGTLTQASFASLRSGLPGTMITTYTYKPLVGITSIADPKGDTTTYVYDSFGRLQYVKDKYDNILSENQYIYGQ